MPGMNNLSIHHIGYAVRSQEDSKAAFESLGARFVYSSNDLERNLSLNFAEMDGGIIELVSPYDNNKTCAVTNMINKQPCTQYHICFQTNSFEPLVEQLKKQGFKQMGKSVISNVYGYKAKGIFMYSRGTGVIEIIEKCG